MTGSGLITVRREVGGKMDGITAFQSLLAPLDLDGAVITLDALHSQTGAQASSPRTNRSITPH
ncbi:hypothetical protein [Streptomyces sp. enrichment culture]|uniref:hypothetical protein n=1 Tax=Streptomyces sp. enrichment culture TaxID=1795815 RepID=UPI003F572F9F